MRSHRFIEFFTTHAQVFRRLANPQDSGLNRRIAHYSELHRLRGHRGSIVSMKLRGRFPVERTTPSHLSGGGVYDPQHGGR